MPDKPRKILLVDGHSLIFRAFHALPLLSSGGVYTNAVQGFFSMLFKAVGQYRPDALCVMLDTHAPTFRHKLYDEYKAGRKPTPEELKPQVPVIREILDAMKVTVCAMEGYEADDLLGTAARLANVQGIHADILTGDRDALQLVTEDTNVILTKKGITESLLIDPGNMEKEYGYTPAQAIDLKALMGDASDNIPGVPGVGEKTALKLLAEYGDLDGVYAHAGEIQGKLGERIRDNRDKAELSKELGTICVTAPLHVDFEDCGIEDMADAIPLMKRYKLRRLSEQLEQLFRERKQSPAPVQAAPRSAEPALRIAPMQPFMTVTDEQKLSLIAKSLAKAGDAVALYTGGTAVAVCAPDGRVWVMPIALDMLTVGMEQEQALLALAPVFENTPLIVHDAKALLHKLKKLKLPLPQIRHDVMIAAYLLEPNQKNADLEIVLHGAAQPKGKAAPPVSPERAARDAYAMMCLCPEQLKLLEENGMLKLFTDMEMPLIRVLFHMEQEGFTVDKAALHELGEQFRAEITKLYDKAIKLSGGVEFNLNSPKQLSEVLFDKLGLPALGRKGKTGLYSTSADVLEQLDHPVIEPILRYRKLTKLESVYVEGLSKLVDATGRVHTTFDQTATVTGRISSLEPNLQNIPVRSEEGREIRKAFTAKEDWLLLDADYSQIELRVLAHLSGDAAMKDAFIKGQDIHTRTAAEVNNVPFENVTAAMRRSAKAVNFGIVYGISGFGLARNIGVSLREADAYIATYFERYPKVKDFMDEAVRLAYERGYAQTILGRRRQMPELKDPSRNVRNFGERAAMNMPVQGSAADIIKLAMAKVFDDLNEKKFEARLILQVHDELVVECPRGEVEKVADLIRGAMENIIKLDVPLVADVSAGNSWYDAK
ncbi:MAG: DNA polymerase I [Clostridiales bacterium]|nr:DNA polymerase I [Clostridiales bacterium]